MQLPSPILVVCSGNLCRSPFAEHLLQHKLDTAGAYAEVFSRGLLDLGGRPVPDNALRAAAEFDLDLSSHRSVHLTPPDLQHAALVLVMSPRQRSHIGHIYPTGIGKVFLLSQPDSGEEIPDPVGQPADVFREVFNEINGYTDAWLRRFNITGT